MSLLKIYSTHDEAYKRDCKSIINYELRYITANHNVRIKNRRLVYQINTLMLSVLFRYIIRAYREI